jgi:23S rRNA pseudouridine1911/1915/1917 synthase
MSRILYEDNHCLALDKPAGLLTMGDHTGEPTLVDVARDYLREKFQKPGNVFVGVVHRLDRPVSGVVLFARTSKGASRLSEQFRVHSIEKQYLAVVEGHVTARQGELTDYLVKDRERNVVSVATNDGTGQECILSFERLECFGRFTLLLIRPKTGRSHQIRVQLASRGWSIVGDRKYGSQVSVKDFIALHALSLTFLHPTTRVSVTVSSPQPEQWQRLLDQR